MAAAIALSMLLLTNCGDISIDGSYPGPYYSGYWWWPASTEAVARGSFSTREPADNRFRLRLDAVNGSIVIIGQPGSGSVQVTAELIVGSDWLTDAQSGLADLDILVTGDSEEIVIQTDQPGIPDGRQYVVNYTVQVPADLEIFVTQTNGDITLEGMRNSVTVAAVNGDVWLLDIFGNADVDLSNGRIESTVNLPPGGEIRLSGGNADIDLGIPTSASAELSALSSIGVVTWDNMALTDLVDTGHSLTGILGSGAGLIRLETVNGNIDITGLDQ